MNIDIQIIVAVLTIVFTIIGAAWSFTKSFKSDFEKLEASIQARLSEDRARSDAMFLSMEARFQANDAKFLAIDNRLDKMYQMFMQLVKHKR